MTNVLRLVFSSLLLCLLLVLCQSRINEKPNIILINIDDLGWRDLGFMGSQFYETPRINQLASRGMVFTQGYAAASNCAPSRASIMTGLWTPRHGIYTVGSSERGDADQRRLIPTPNTVSLADSFVILPELLKQAGYRTCHAGKWHLSVEPKEHGFDENIGGGHNGHPQSYYPPYGNVDLKPFDNQSYLTDVIMTHVLEFVRQTDGPFFL
ncbi:MAG: sulfatase-like hydrolase/transferase, partial [Saprospiraceae bacterium]|nr:sulfatase-like hydrolase/transferase [Saprospiraceae bacterium]